MTRLAAVWNRYWFREAPLLDLAVLRVLAVGAGCVELAFGNYGAGAGSVNYQPVLLVELLAGCSPPSAGLLQGLRALGLVAGALACVGLGTRAALPVFALLFAFLEGHASSFGSFHHARAPLCIALVALAASPAGGALSVDRWIARRRACGTPLPSTSPLAGWAPLLVRWIVALVFLSAALSKLAGAGLEWANGYTLQFAFFAKGAQLEKPLGVWLSRHHELCRALSLAVLLLEASFALVLARPALARLFVPAAALFLVATELCLGAAFHPMLALLGAFVPWERLCAKGEYEPAAH